MRARRTAVGLAALSGVLYWAACPPLGLWPLAFLCWVPLLVAMRSASPRWAALLGGVQGLAAYFALGAWLPDVVRTFAPLHPVVCWAIPLLVAAQSALGVALCAWAEARASRSGFPAGLVFTLALGVKEAFYPMLFPVSAALQVHDVPALLQLAEIGGPALVGVPLTAANVGLAGLVRALPGRRAPVRAVAVALSVPVAALVFGIWRMAVVDAAVRAAPAARIAIVQANTPHAGTTLRAAIEAHVAATRAIEAGGPVDLVVWPETAFGGVVRDGELEATVRREVLGGPDGGDAPRVTSPVLSGVMLRRGTRLTNSAALFDASGTLHGTYDKVHPLVFGEYIPLGERFPALRRWLPNAGHLTAGAPDQPALELGGHRIETLVCYEDVLPDFTNDVARRTHPHLLVNLANDAWFGHSAAASLHFALAQLRAVEHRRYLVVAGNSGVSGFVDPDGRASGVTPVLEAATRVGVVHWLDGETIFERVGEAPWGCAAVAVLLMALGGIRVSAASRSAAAVRRGAAHTMSNG